MNLKSTNNSLNTFLFAIKSNAHQRKNKMFSTVFISILLSACGGNSSVPEPKTVPLSVAQESQNIIHNTGDIGDPVALPQAIAAPRTAALTSLNPDDYITIESGMLPVVISAPHGGEMVIPGVAIRSSGTTVMDWNTYPIAIAIQSKLYAKTGKRAYLVAAKASRKYVDFNRSADLAYESSLVKPIYDRYYGALNSAVTAAKLQAPAAALLIDVHGQSSKSSVTYRGTRDGQTANNTIFYTAPNGLITTMNALGLSVNPTSAGARDNVNFNGGNIVWVFGKNNNAGINSVQFEFGYNFRDTDAHVDSTASKVCDAIIAHLRSTGAL